jgi:hypothetical protein
MATPDPITAPTNWQAVFVTMLIPLTVAAGLIYAALMPNWDESSRWAYGLLALPPAEFARALVLSILGDAFGEFRSRRAAIKGFLLSMAILAFLVGGIALIACLFGVRDAIQIFTSVQTWKMIVPAAAVVAADGVIALAFFSGDARAQAARLDATAYDTLDALGLMLYPTPLLVAAGYGALLWLKEKGVAIAAGVPQVTAESVRSILLVYAAVYFVAKACAFAYPQTALFNRSGKRLLGGSWVGWLRSRNKKQRIDELREERTATMRRRALLGLDG